MMSLNLKANCGCGWTESTRSKEENNPAIGDLPSPERVLEAAKAHADIYRHTVEVRGEARP